jgi:hypothetical protein
MYVAGKGATFGCRSRRPRRRGHCGGAGGLEGELLHGVRLLHPVSFRSCASTASYEGRRRPSGASTAEEAALAQITEHHRPLLRGDPWVASRCRLRPSVDLIAAVGSWCPAPPRRCAAPQHTASATRATRAANLDGTPRIVLPKHAHAGEKARCTAVVTGGSAPLIREAALLQNSL